MSYYEGFVLNGVILRNSLLEDKSSLSVNPSKPSPLSASPITVLEARRDGVGDFAARKGMRQSTDTLVSKTLACNCI